MGLALPAQVLVLAEKVLGVESLLPHHLLGVIDHVRGDRVGWRGRRGVVELWSGSPVLVPPFSYSSSLLWETFSTFHLPFPFPFPLQRLL